MDKRPRNPAPRQGTSQPSEGLRSGLPSVRGWPGWLSMPDSEPEERAMRSVPVEHGGRSDVLPDLWRADLHALGALVEHLDIGVVFEDAAGRVCVVNSALCQVFGIDASPGDMIGRSCRDCAQEAKELFTDPDAFLAGFDRADRDPVCFSERLRLRDGRVLERSFRPMEEQDGILWQYKDVTEDVHLQLALASSEGPVRAIVASTPDAVVAMDDRGRIREFNPSAQGLFGWRPDEVIGLPLGEVLVPDHLRAGYYERVDRAIASGSTELLGHVVRVSALHKCGEVITVDVIAFRMEVDGARWFSAFAKKVD